MTPGLKFSLTMLARITVVVVLLPLAWGPDDWRGFFGHPARWSLLVMLPGGGVLFRLICKDVPALGKGQQTTGGWLLWVWVAFELALVLFLVQGDRKVFATALASCCAKYARELEMRAFNAYFARLQPELAPTAGYRGDGARWLADAHLALAKSGLARELLVRSR